MKFYLTKNMTLKWDLHKILTVCSDKKCGCGVSAVINVGRNCQNSKLENDVFFHRNDQSGLRDETKQLFQEELDTTMGKMGHMIKEMADKATLPNNDSQHLKPLTTTTKTVDGINSTFNFLPNSNGQSVMHVKVRINPDSEYSSKKGKADQLLIPNSRKADDVDKKEKNNKKISFKKSSDTKAMTECAFHTKPSSVLPNENKCSKCNKMLPVSPANIQEVSGAVKQIVHTTGTSIDSSLHASSPTSTDSQITSTDKMKVSGKFSDIHYHKIKSQKVLSSSKDGEEKQIDNTGNKITKCTEQVIKTSSNGAVEKVNTVPPPPLQKASEKSLLRSEQREKMPEAPNIKASLTSSPVVHKTDVLSKDAVKMVNDGEKDLLPSGGKMVITGNSSGFKIHMEDAEKIVTTTSTVTDNTEDGESKRKCFGCGNQEAVFKTYKKCQRCKQEQIKNARYYCGKNCQVADWTARHKMEHIGGKLV